MFDGEEVSGVPMTIPALVREITCCLAAYLEAPPVKAPPVKAAPVKVPRAKR